MESEEKTYLNKSFTVGITGEKATEIIAGIKTLSNEYKVNEDIIVPKQNTEKLTKIKINKDFLRDVWRFISKQNEDETISIGFEKDRPVLFELEKLGVKIFVAPIIGSD